jgi:hypothetical protein
MDINGDIPKMGYPQFSSIFGTGIFHEINHAALMGVPHN